MHGNLTLYIHVASYLEMLESAYQIIWYHNPEYYNLSTHCHENMETLEANQQSRFPDFITTAQDGGKVVSLTHRPPLPPGNVPGTHFCWSLSRPQDHSVTARIMSLKNSNDTNRNQTHLNHYATVRPLMDYELYPKHRENCMIYRRNC